MVYGDNRTNNGTGPIDEASVLPVILLISLLLALSIVVTHRLLHFFARADTPIVMRILVGLSWFMGIAGVLVLLPSDLVGELYGVAVNLIDIAWRVVYWVTFFLAWILCPVAMEYHAAGHFTFKARMWEAVKSNVKVYLAIGLVLVILGGTLAATRGLQMTFVLAAVNFYGMFLIVFMLGYGVVEVPMAFWRAADPVRALQSHEFRAGTVETALVDAEDIVNQTVEELVAFRRRLGRNGDEELIRQCDKVLERAPRREAIPAAANASSFSRLSGTIGRSISAVASNESTGKLDMETLAKMNAKLKRSLVAAERARWDWDDLLERTAYLERLLQERRRIDPTNASVVMDGVDAEAPPTAEEEEEEAGIMMDTPLKRARRSCRMACEGCRVRGYTHFYRAAAVISGMLSLVLLWCACISPFSKPLSLFGKIIHEANNMVTVFMGSFLPLMYMAVCIYTALFKFKYLDVLALHGNRQTDAYNLLYNASYMGRLQFSLGVFYFQMLYQQDSSNTAFVKLVGDMDTTAFIGVSFNQYSPFLILFFSSASFFNCGDRLLDFLGVSTHRRPRKGNQEHEERIMEGRRLISEARARRERERRRAQQAPSALNGAGPSRDGGYARVEDLLERL